jgi:transposase
MQAITIGLDIARSVLKVHGAGERGRSVLSKRTSRGDVSAFFANLSGGMIGRQALAGARYRARGFPGARKNPQLMPPSYVRASKSADAEACVEAVSGVCSADAGPHIQNAG